ncbi:serine/threonine-protein kinase RIO3-like [Gigantopelta aegis]|uniref:serine/threonine-protein kinase RIO3-like n=1 Tax=Gigantopelta aegis TaxID=1735272 RepID=UPI001B88CD99|nr:serine/threonine-protein kinase RIO3-like [Gigantopelta aegis]
MEGTITENPLTTSNAWAKTSTPVSSPWGKKVEVMPCSLEDVMSEQLASELAIQETRRVDITPVDSCCSGAESADDLSYLLTDQSKLDGCNDELIARMLQLEFDREHNALLTKEQQKLNGSNKVCISFENYKTLHPSYEEEDDEEKLKELQNREPEETKWHEKTPQIGRSGFVCEGSKITTKHDKVICGRRNAERLMEFPPEFDSGDGEGMDMQLPNHVYNSLKVHSIRENNRAQRLHEKKEHSTAEHAVDSKTRLMMYKLVNSGILESVTGAISGGKEAQVFHAFGGEVEDKCLPKECALKVYKTTLNEFKNREKYIHGDRRFFKDDFKKANPRKIMKLWAEKEAYNLNRMKKFSVPCPSVVALKKHVLVMSFIGKDGHPAPKLKDAKLSPENLEDAFDQTVKIMKKLQTECSLVHADLSEFNMLWHNNTVHVIDVSQSVDLMHPKAMEFLYRDCYNVNKFFDKRGVHNVPSPEKLFNDVTGLDIQGTGADFVAQVQRCDKERKEALTSHSNQYKEYAFDYFFDISQSERSAALDKLVLSDSDEEVVDTR